MVLVLLLVLLFAGCINETKNETSATTTQAATAPSNMTQGKYFDDKENQIGTCTEEFVPSPIAYPYNNVSYGGTYYNKFYDLNGNFLGSCWHYSGPGASGGCKGDCDENSTINKIGTRIKIGPCAGITAQAYECKTG